MGAGNSKSHHEIFERPPSALVASPEARFSTDRILVESQVDGGVCPNALSQQAASAASNKKFLNPPLLKELICLKIFLFLDFQQNMASGGKCQPAKVLAVPRTARVRTLSRSGGRNGRACGSGQRKQRLKIIRVRSNNLQIRVTGNKAGRNGEIELV